MYKILAITPYSIAGELIIKGLAQGFLENGNQVLVKDIRELDKNEIILFKPDFAIGYDYAHLYESNVESIISELNIPMVHYFADNPKSNLSDAGDRSLFLKLQNSNGLIFCWDKNYLKDFECEAHYLPLGICSSLYDAQKEDWICDIAFVGRPLGDKRQKILSSIIKNFPNQLNIYCYGKHFENSVNEIKEKKLLDEKELEIYLNSYKGFLKNEKELARVYKNSKISLNITIQGQNNMNYRVFEVPASEGLLFTDMMQDTVDYFKNEEDIVIYKDVNDLILKIKKYLSNETLRKSMIINSKRKIVENHSFRERAKDIVSKIHLLS